jgi:NAD(P)H-dependent FMN reductase
MRPLSIPVILGTTRRGRLSAHVARFVANELSKRPGVVTELIDIKEVPAPVDGAGDEIKDPLFSQRMDASDGLVIVAPEYNHSFPGLLKHVLDTCLEEYIQAAASSGSLKSLSTRVVESSSRFRELGLMTTFTDLNFSKVGDAFDEEGKLKNEEAWARRAANFLDELVWMSTVLRYGRENVPQE